MGWTTHFYPISVAVDLWEPDSPAEEEQNVPFQKNLEYEIVQYQVNAANYSQKFEEKLFLFMSFIGVVHTLDLYDRDQRYKLVAQSNGYQHPRH